MNCNDNYFELINTEDKAYWLGFLYADGCVTQDHKTVILVLSIKDIKHVEKFKETTSSEYKIGGNKENTYARTCIYSAKMAEYLIAKGCVPAKTFILKFPTYKIIPQNLIRHFIRGYFDGDGCIFANYRHKKNSTCVYLSTELNILGTEDMINGIAVNIGVNSKIEYRKKDHIYALRIYNKTDILAMMDYMYNDASVFLDRKYQKFLEIKEYVNNKKIA